MLICSQISSFRPVWWTWTNISRPAGISATMGEDSFGDSSKHVVWMFTIINNISEGTLKVKWQHHKWKPICTISSMLTGCKESEKTSMLGSAETSYREQPQKKASTMDAHSITGDQRNCLIFWGKTTELLKKSWKLSWTLRKKNISKYPII